ncbi:MAG: hypothetical protein J5I92_15040 [Thiogranum sp.]|nr:hypothetical protein [Thiogranum sp.]
MKAVDLRYRASRAIERHMALLWQAFAILAAGVYGIDAVAEFVSFGFEEAVGELAIVGALALVWAAVEPNLAAMQRGLHSDLAFGKFVPAPGGVELGDDARPLTDAEYAEAKRSGFLARPGEQAWLKRRLLGDRLLAVAQVEVIAVLTLAAGDAIYRSAWAQEHVSIAACVAAVLVLAVGLVGAVAIGDLVEAFSSRTTLNALKVRRAEQAGKAVSTEGIEVDESGELPTTIKGLHAYQMYCVEQAAKAYAMKRFADRKHYLGQYEVCAERIRELDAKEISARKSKG